MEANEQAPCAALPRHHAEPPKRCTPAGLPAATTTPASCSSRSPTISLVGFSSEREGVRELLSRFLVLRRGLGLVGGLEVLGLEAFRVFAVGPPVLDLRGQKSVDGFEVGFH